jgi:peptidyl-dipeptidase Dcp
MAENLAEVERIAADPAAPTFENTLAELERAGRTSSRVGDGVRRLERQRMSTPEFQAVQREMAPRLAAFSDRIFQNEALFRRIAAVYDSRARSPRSSSAWPGSTTPTSCGPARGSTGRPRRASPRSTSGWRSSSPRFNQNVLADETDHTGAGERGGAGRAAGVAARRRAAARPPAASREVGDHQHALIDRPVPHLLRAARPARARLAHVRGRGDNGGATTTTDHRRDPGAPRRARAAAGLRDPRALAPREHHGGTPERALELMEAVWTPARRASRGGGRHAGDRPRRGRRHHHRAVGLPLLRREGAQGPATTWTRTRSSRTCSSTGCARGCSGWRASCSASSSPGAGRARVPPRRGGVGGDDRPTAARGALFYFDPYARQGKRSGAWMNAYRTQERFDGEVTTIVSNNSNFVQGPAGRARAHLLGRRARRCSTSSATRCTACRRT